MNKIIILAAVLAACMTLSSATKLSKKLGKGHSHGHGHGGLGGHSHHHHDEFDDFEGGHGGLHGGHGGGFHSGGHGGLGHSHGHGHLGGFSDELLFDELGRRGHHGFRGGHHGGFRRPHRRGHRGGHIGGAGGAIGGGAGIGGHESHFGGIRDNTHLGSHGSIEGHQGSVLGKSNHLDVDHHESGHLSGGKIHKHEGHDNDRIIIKEHNRGNTDIDGARISTGHSEGDHLGVGSSTVLGQESGGRLSGGKNFDHETSAVGGGDSGFNAGVVGGATGGIGGAEF